MVSLETFSDSAISSSVQQDNQDIKKPCIRIKPYNVHIKKPPKKKREGEKTESRYDNHTLKDMGVMHFSPKIDVYTIVTTRVPVSVKPLVDSIV